MNWLEMQVAMAAQKSKPTADEVRAALQLSGMLQMAETLREKFNAKLVRLETQQCVCGDKLAFDVGGMAVLRWPDLKARENPYVKARTG